MRRYRNHPGGMGPISENISRSGCFVALEDMIATGNRAQRRFAQKRLAEIQRRQLAAKKADSPKSDICTSADVCTSTI